MDKDDHDQKIQRYAGMLAESFRDDPGLKVQLAGLEDRERLLRALCRGQVEAFEKLGAVRALSDRGLTICFPAELMETAEFAAAGAQTAQYLLQVATEQELRSIQANAMKLMKVTQPDWYARFTGEKSVAVLQVILVAPQHRNSGVFRRLLTPLLEQCSREGRILTLQTHEKENVPIYEHFGFELMETLHSEELDITCYNMLHR